MTRNDPPNGNIENPERIKKYNKLYGTEYMAVPSYPKGQTPEHLKEYTHEFVRASRDCAGTKGVNKRERRTAFQICVKKKLRGEEE